MDGFESFENKLLAEKAELRRIAVVCGSDESTIQATVKAVEQRLATVIFVGATEAVRQALGEKASQPGISLVEASDEREAARLAVSLIREGRADVLMKGLVETPILLQAVLDKQQGLLPLGGVLTHVAVSVWPGYDKPLVYSDVAVIPHPTPLQRRAQINALVAVCRSLGVVEPRIALVHCAEHVSDKFPHTLDYADVVRESKEGRWSGVIIDGPLDLRTAIDPEALRIKGINSPLQGRADALLFPDIVSGNVFYKSMTYLVQSATAGMLMGAASPVILSSRGDNAETKYDSLLLACLFQS